MIRVSLSRRDRRALLAGGAAILFVIGVTRMVPAVASWQRETRVANTELQGSLAHARLQIARAGEARESTLARGRRLIALAPGLLGGESPASAGASLASLLAGAAATSNVRLGVVQLRGDTLAPTAFTRIGAHVEGTGDIRGVAQLLSTLEGGTTLLVIRTLAITQPDPVAGDDRIEALHLELDVEGLMLNPRRSK